MPKLFRIVQESILTKQEMYLELAVESYKIYCWVINNLIHFNMTVHHIYAKVVASYG